MHGLTGKKAAQERIREPFYIAFCYRNVPEVVLRSTQAERRLLICDPVCVMLSFDFQ